MAHLTLRVPERINLKMLSALVVCCIFLLTLFDLCKMEANSVDPDQTAPIGAV